MKGTKEQKAKYNKEKLQTVVAFAPSVRPTSKSRQNKGITLIALIITIIVMLILVAVTINMAVNGGLFEKAGEAVGETENAVNKEQELSNGKIEIGGVLYDSIDDYINKIPSSIHNWTRTGDTFTCSHCNVTCKMGQEVDYTPAESPSKTGKLESIKVASTRKTVIASMAAVLNITTITAEKSGLDKYYAENGKYPAGADENGTQTIVAYDDGTKWIVLGIEDTNKDGINETLLITTKYPQPGLSFYGVAAYNNGPSEINRICEELYSNSEYGKARGMTIEDVNRALNYIPLGGYYADGESKQIHTTGNLTTKLKDLPIWKYIKQTGTYTPDGTNLENYELNGYFYDLNDDGTELINTLDGTTSPVTTVEKDIIFGSSKDYKYWLASNCLMAFTDIEEGKTVGGCLFIPRLIMNGQSPAFPFYMSNNETFPDAADLDLRPVVTLKNELPQLSR